MTSFLLKLFFLISVYAMLGLGMLNAWSALNPGSLPAEIREEAKALAADAMRYGYTCALQRVTVERCAIDLRQLLDATDRATRK